VGRVLIEYPIESLRSMGANEVFIIVGPEPEFDLLKSYFGDGSPWGMEFTFLCQRNRHGLASAIELLRGHVASPFAVALGDDVTLSRSLAKGLRLFTRKNADALEFCISESDASAIRRSCSIRFDHEFHITEILEKPRTPSPGYRGIGIYLFRETLFDFIAATPVSPRSGQVELTDTIRGISQHGGAYTYPISGSNVNVNVHLDFLRASELVLKQLQRSAAGTRSVEPEPVSGGELRNRTA
jgi:dTDP-glucose pyrophosphorylase